MENALSVAPVERLVRTLRDIQIGDVVFVAYQQRRCESQQRTEMKPVVKVGRKYGYLREGHCEERFDLETGLSVHHPDSNGRANGFGFDVYLSENDFFAKQFRDKQRARLQERLIKNFGRLADLPHDVVNKIHEILDGAGIE